ncbi:cyclically-permuted mutarotase family protein [Shewanella sp. 0m-8]
MKLTKLFFLLMLFVVLACGQVLAVESKAKAIIQAKVSWVKAGQLPAPKGFNESIGIAGAYSAFVGNYLVVAGGANFPSGHPFFDKGIKQYYSDIFVFDTANNQFELVAHGHLPSARGHGATVVVGNSLYLVGGKNNVQAFDSILKLTLDDNLQPLVTAVNQLPFTWDSGAAAWQDDSLFLFAGKHNGVVSNSVCQFSLKHQKCINKDKIAPIPGLARADFPAIQHQKQFYVFGGANLQVGKGRYILTDAYAFEFETLSWRTLTPITVKDQPYSVVGGGVAVINDEQLILLGGVNRQVFNDAIFQLTTSSKDRLSKFKQYYFALNEQEVNFSRQQLIYDLNKDNWSTLSKEVPFTGGAGPLAVSQKDNQIYWISGEIRPVIRTPNVYQATVEPVQ